MFRNNLKLAGATAIVAAAAAVASSSPAATPDAAYNPHCVLATLHGYYGFTLSGKRPDGQVVGVAMTYFDGRGSLSQTDNTNADSGVGPPDRPADGKYTLNSDCTGTMTIIPDVGPPLDLAIAVDNNGTEVRTAAMTPGVLVTSTGHRVLQW
ncbi:MAG: hypothetical protein U1F23_03515 [Lysobacterales bacterium]